ncbi:hypothetical protein COLO4_36369 [Corchorus olitorius]|uniref:TIR domain-containing protein n=1 Tax=Corchorus olitorius TaxID=93759 RepID=A0A1R3G9B2_9ROSI|nr:hypothetical protein COLO4_36369 [Corchorus olitorius]
MALKRKRFSEAACSSSSSNPKYEVFLSFRGEDTRKNFTDHLYTALVMAGVHTFRDDDELQRGKDISSELVKAIEESKISLVVFSKGYASSRWCLNELVKITECKNKLGQIVLPIFYDVDPSDVRNQTKSYAKAFAQHEDRFAADMEMIKRWRAALTEAANLSGWHLQNVADGHESKFIQKIVEDVLRNVNQSYLHVATHPVAVEFRKETVIRLLSMESPNVRIVGIYGMGGIGKTTIAKAVYNSLCDGFDGSSFLSDIKDKSKLPNGLATLQQQLLSDILKLKGMIRIDNVDRGINLIQQRLRYRRVFIVLDDVDDSSQLKSLVGDQKWFGLGSKIIVTTRDERLLTELEVDKRYKVQKLDPHESIQLFSWYAFRRPAPKDDYLQLSESVVDHVQGLPLALEVLGSCLFSRSLLEWKSVLEKLQQIPHDQIQKKLRISFDTLDDQLKAIFLDIACFFIGMDKEYVMTILNGCGFSSVINLSVLVERSLITIGQNDNEIQMHDLLRDMGREIVREMSPNQIGKRSRLWFHQEVVNGSKAVEGVSLDVSAKEDAIVLRTEAFAKMMNLRLLKINSVSFSTTCYDKFSKELRWLCWHRCSLQVLPPNLDLDSLVVLDMRFSNLKSVWKGIKFPDKLEILDLSYSIRLVETPNFCRCNSLKRLQLEGCTSLSKVHQSIGNLERLAFLNLAECNSLGELPDNICNLTSLETLNLSGCSKLLEIPNFCRCKSLTRLELEGCTSLTKVHQSIGDVERLEFLNLAECKNLRELPDSICNLTSLETLNLSGCSKLSSFPEHLGKLKALRDLLTNGSAITELPTSVGLLKNLENLSLAGLKEGDSDSPSRSWLSFFSSRFSPKCSTSSSLLLPATFIHLTSLRQLNLRDRNLRDNDLAIDFRSFQFLWSLNLGGNKFCNLPAGISDHPTLVTLRLNECKSLQSIEELPPNLENFEAQQCRSIERYPILAISQIWITNCRTTTDIQGWDVRQMSHTRGSAVCWVFGDSGNEPEELRFQSKGKFLEGCFPARKVPDWFDYTQLGSAVLFCMPSIPTGQFRAMIVCVIMHPVNEESTPAYLILSFKNKTKGSETFDRSSYPLFDGKLRQDHAWVGYIIPDGWEIVADEGDEIEVSVKPRGGILVKECGIHLPIHETN